MAASPIRPPDPVYLLSDPSSKTSNKAINTLIEKVVQNALINPSEKLNFKSLQGLIAIKNRIKQEIELEEKSSIGKMSRFLGKKIFNTSSSSTHLAVLIKDYKALEHVCAEVINQHPTLQKVKKVEEMIFKMKTLISKGEVNAEFSAEFDRLTTSFKLVGNIKAMLSPGGEDQWETFKEDLIQGFENIRSSRNLSSHHIQWLHGTRSPAMAIMLATAKALIPTGQLLTHNIIPLTGELGLGITGKGVNRERISGTSLTQVGVKTTIDYATDSAFIVSKEREWAHISQEKLKKIITNSNQVISKDPDLTGTFSEGVKFDWLSCGLYLERLKVIDPDFKEKIILVKNQISDLLIENRENLYVCECLTELLRRCDTPAFIKPTDDIRNAVYSSFPVVLGSVSKAGEALDTPSGRELDEHLVRGTMQLETDIQVAFVETEHVDRLKTMFASAEINIEVMDFNTLKLLEGREFLRS